MGVRRIPGFYERIHLRTLIACHERLLGALVPIAFRPHLVDRAVSSYCQDPGGWIPTALEELRRLVPDEQKDLLQQILRVLLGAHHLTQECIYPSGKSVVELTERFFATSHGY